ncbi:uncharacterized protein G2W53_010141 [Senna tora]|uniref:Uncharacterized protein n=1 Tax=Senna tora TaxID=362788 RepID=A0A834WZ44_9FABA|nr:uncharacterized protein G2W53_010141 [Senna tora]
MASHPPQVNLTTDLSLAQPSSLIWIKRCSRWGSKAPVSLGEVVAALDAAKAVVALEEAICSQCC